MTSVRRTPTGFTLLELLVAVAILGLLTIFTLQGLRVGLGAWSASERTAAQRHAVQEAVSVLRRTIQSAYPAYVNGVPDDLRIAFSGADDTLTIIAPLPTGVGDGVMARERFFVAASGEDHALFEDWQLDLPSTQDEPVANRVLLAPGIKSVRFGYFGQTLDGGAPQWQDRWVDRTSPPLLVRVLLEPEPPAKNNWPEVVVHPRVTTNTACLFETATLQCQKQAR